VLPLAANGYKNMLRDRLNALENTKAYFGDDGQ